MTYRNSGQGGNAQATLTCGAPKGGAWAALPATISGECWNFNFCYDVPTRDVAALKTGALAGKKITSETLKAGTAGNVTNLCYQLVKEATQADLAINEYSHCTSATILEPKLKQLCVWDEQTPPQVTPDTGDDMFKINSPAAYGAHNGAFVENINIGPIGHNGRLKWLERTKSGPYQDKAIMLPSGPWTGATAFSDYKAFMMNAPAEAAAVEDACYPVRASLCETPPPPPAPPTNGLCGPASGKTFKAASAIPAGDRCYVGNPSAIAQSGNSFSWSCQGIPASQKADMCTAALESGEITREDPPPANEVTPPSDFCFFHVSGLLISNSFVDRWFTEIGKVDTYSNLVGVGEYPNAEPFARANQYTFDGIAFGRDTTVTIYAQPNFQGNVILHQKGPGVINNRIWRGNAMVTSVDWQNSVWPGVFHGQFPSSSRVWSNSDMHYWGSGTSLKVTCDES